MFKWWTYEGCMMDLSIGISSCLAPSEFVVISKSANLTMVGLSAPKKQWAAVKTWFLLISVPPQSNLIPSPLEGIPKAVAHGQAFRTASVPPTTLPISWIPHAFSGSWGIVGGEGVGGEGVVVVVVVGVFLICRNKIKSDKNVCSND